MPRGQALRKLKLHLDYELVSNDEMLLILPPGVDKASGINEALREFGVSRHNLVAIGNAENDLPLFASAEHAVAVNNSCRRREASGRSRHRRRLLRRISWSWRAT